MIVVENTKAFRESSITTYPLSTTRYVRSPLFNRDKDELKTN